MLGIVGSGALGCLWAAQLYKQTEFCFVITEPYRQKHKLALPYSSQSFAVLSKDVPPITREILAPQLAPQQAIKPDSTILIMTKSYDVDAAIDALLPFLGPDNIVVLFQNGMGSQQRACDLLGNTPCFAAVTTEGANKPSPHKLIHAGRGETIIGPMNNAAQNTGQQHWFSELAASELSIRYDYHIAKRLLIKLAINCAINPFTAICSCRNGDVRKQVLFQATWLQLRSELTSLLNHAGVTWTESELEESVFDVMTKTANNQSSMLQDIINNKPTEIDDINGFAYRYLQRHSLPFVANKSLSEQVHALRG